MLSQELQDILEVSSFTATMKNQLDMAMARFKTACHFAVAGGLFELNPANLMYWQTLGPRQAIVDSRGTPVLIEDVPALYKEGNERYHEAVNAYFNEWRRITLAKTVQEIVGVYE